jgi:hypothetical protein
VLFRSKEVKKGDCSTLKECLTLFEDMWKENHPENLMFSTKPGKADENLFSWRQKS